MFPTCLFYKFPLIIITPIKEEIAEEVKIVGMIAIEISVPIIIIKIRTKIKTKTIIIIFKI